MTDKNLFAKEVIGTANPYLTINIINTKLTLFVCYAITPKQFNGF